MSKDYDAAPSTIREEAPVARRQTFHQIGDVGYNIVTKGLGIDALGNNMGRGTATLDLNMLSFRKRLAALGMSVEQFAQAEELARATYAWGQQLCESPIERDVLAALLVTQWHEGFWTVPPRVHAPKSQPEMPAGDLVIVPQMAFVRFRVDFMVIATSSDYRKMFAVECDGADFHKDPEKDRARDLYLSSWDIPTFRIKGTDIVAEAEDAIREVVNCVNEWRAKH